MSVVYTSKEAALAAIKDGSIFGNARAPIEEQIAETKAHLAAQDSNFKAYVKANPGKVSHASHAGSNYGYDRKYGIEGGYTGD